MPQSDYKAVSELSLHGHILNQDYEGNDVLLEVEVPEKMVEQFSKYEVFAHPLCF